MKHLIVIETIERIANAIFGEYWREYFCTVDLYTSEFTFGEDPIYRQSHLEDTTCGQVAE